MRLAQIKNRKSSLRRGSFFGAGGTHKAAALAAEQARVKAAAKKRRSKRGTRIRGVKRAGSLRNVRKGSRTGSVVGDVGETIGEEEEMVEVAPREEWEKPEELEVAVETALLRESLGAGGLHSAMLHLAGEKGLRKRLWKPELPKKKKKKKDDAAAVFAAIAGGLSGGKDGSDDDTDSEDEKSDEEKARIEKEHALGGAAHNKTLPRWLWYGGAAAQALDDHEATRRSLQIVADGGVSARASRARQAARLHALQHGSQDVESLRDHPARPSLTAVEIAIIAAFGQQCAWRESARMLRKAEGRNKKAPEVQGEHSLEFLYITDSEEEEEEDGGADGRPCSPPPSAAALAASPRAERYAAEGPVAKEQRRRLWAQTAAYEAGSTVWAGARAPPPPPPVHRTQRKIPPEDDCNPPIILHAFTDTERERLWALFDERLGFSNELKIDIICKYSRKPVNFLQNTFSDRTHCIAQLRPGSSFLLSVLRFLDRSIECYTSEWATTYLPAVIFFILIFVIGVPVGLIYMLKKSDLEDIHTRRKFGALYLNYEPQYWYWPVDIHDTHTATHTHMFTRTFCMQ